MARKKYKKLNPVRRKINNVKYKAKTRAKVGFGNKAMSVLSETIFGRNYSQKMIGKQVKKDELKNIRASYFATKRFIKNNPGLDPKVYSNYHYNYRSKKVNNSIKQGAKKDGAIIVIVGIIVIVIGIIIGIN